MRRTARSGSRWTAIQFGGARFTTFLTFLILARVLPPKAFGVVAIATVFVSFLQIIIEGGFSQALIQRKDLEPAHIETVFWVSVGTGAFLAAGLALASGPLSKSYHEPQLAGVLRLLSIGLFASALGSTQAAQLRRAMRFKPMAVRAIVSNVLGSVTGVVLAVLGAGVWALALQYVVLNIAQTTLLWVATDWRPSFHVSKGHFHDIFGFSRHSLGNALMQFTTQRSDDFLVGSVLGTVPLGLYTVAYRLISTFNDIINQMLLGVAFPAFSRLQSDTQRLSRAYLLVLQAGASLAFPSYLFFVTSSSDVVLLFFGRKWLAAAPVMSVLAIFGALQTSILITDSCLTAIGKPQIVFRNRLISTIVQVAAFAVAAPFGIIWVAWSLVARAYLLAPLPVVSLMRAGIIEGRTWLKTFLPPALCTALMLATTLGLHATVLNHLAPAPRLALTFVSATTVYLASLRLVDKEIAGEVAKALLLRRLGYSRRAARRAPETRVDGPTTLEGENAIALDSAYLLALKLRDPWAQSGTSYTAQSYIENGE